MRLHTTFCRTLTLVTCLALLGAGCGRASTPGTPSTDGSRSSSGSGLSGCRHEYYPIANGYSMSYSSRAGTYESSYTIRVTSVDGNKATLVYDFESVAERSPGASLNQEIICEGGRLISKGNVDFGSALTGQSIEFETVSASGDLLPPNLGVGSEWTQHFETRGTLNMPGIPESMREITSETTMTRKAVGEESVTVPAGTYTALKVIATHAIISSVGGREPTETTFDLTEYWVKNVGLVKTVGNDMTMEATSVTVP